jgi:hypothetical protein
LKGGGSYPPRLTADQTATFKSCNGTSRTTRGVSVLIICYFGYLPSKVNSVSWQ